MLGQQTWLEIQCQTYHDAGGAAVALVLGYDRDHYFQTLDISAASPPESIALGGCTVRLLHNLSPDSGPFSSLKIVSRWVLEATHAPAAFLLPIDTPLSSPEVLQALLGALRSGIDVVQPRYENRGGHPVLLSRDFLSMISAVDLHDPTARLDVQIHRHAESGKVATVNVGDERVLLNLNDAEAWQRYLTKVKPPEVDLNDK